MEYDGYWCCYCHQDKARLVPFRDEMRFVPCVEALLAKWRLLMKMVISMAIRVAIHAEISGRNGDSNVGMVISTWTWMLECRNCTDLCVATVGSWRRTNLRVVALVLYMCIVGVKPSKVVGSVESWKLRRRVHEAWLLSKNKVNCFVLRQRQLFYAVICL